jgi:hypothetical protein
MSKNFKFILIISTALIILIVFVFMLFAGTRTKTNTNNLLVEIPTLPEIEWPRAVSVGEPVGGRKIVTNQFDGYNISVPENWIVNKMAYKNGGLRIIFSENYDPGTFEIESGLLFSIMVFENPNRMDIKNWIADQKNGNTEYLKLDFKEVQHPIGTAYVAEYLESQEESTMPDYRNTGSAHIYLFSGNSRIYLLSCYAFTDANTLIPICEQQIQTFKLLNKDLLSGNVPFSSDEFEISVSGIDENTGDVKYTIYIKPKLPSDDDGYKKEIEELTKSASDWIVSKGINPDDLKLEWSVK